MKRIRFPRLFAATALATTLMYPELASAAPAPKLHDDNPKGKFGDWYTGAVPPNASDDKPVILFVQGLHADYKTWSAKDSYYEAAYNAGYRTAFVQLKDADGPGGNMWTNGPVLAEVIKKVAKYYNVPQINIIAHSKGGIDTQAALVHYQASPYVNVVHQLSTPNRGSELADLAYSNWAGWLANLLGKRDDAVYSLQTSYMADFRSKTDNRSENDATTTYTAGGTGDDGIFSATWFAHALLPGDDDGAVSIASALGLPNGIEGFTKEISHSKMAKASETWSLVEPKLQKSGSTERKQKNQARKSAAKLRASEESSMILRGGSLTGSKTATFFLESGINQFTLDTMTSSDETKVVLNSPSGSKYEALSGNEDQIDEASVFQNAVHHVFEVKAPEAGEWKIELEGSNDAFFAIGYVEGGEVASVKAKQKVYQKGEKAQVAIDLGTSKIDRKSLGTAKLTKSKNQNKNAQIDKVKLQLKDDRKLVGAFTVPKQPGVYNLSFDVTGINGKGEPFSRSINYNFAVTDSDGKLK